MHTIFLIWQNSQFEFFSFSFRFFSHEFFFSYYHQKDQFSHLLEVVSSEIVRRAKQIIGEDISSTTNERVRHIFLLFLNETMSVFLFKKSMGLKDALSICAMFRGTYLDYKEKGDVLNEKYLIPEKKYRLFSFRFESLELNSFSFVICHLIKSIRMDPSKMLIWHINPYGETDPNKDLSSINDPYSVMRKSSPWPQRNAKCFQQLNSLIERFSKSFQQDEHSFCFLLNFDFEDVTTFKNYKIR